MTREQLQRGRELEELIATNNLKMNDIVAAKSAQGTARISFGTNCQLGITLTSEQVHTILNDLHDQLIRETQSAEEEFRNL